jgi:type II secretion system protein N
VKRLLKILIVTIVVLVAAAFGGVWYLNRWLKSPETHARVERELSRALKLPLKFRSLEISLLGGLRAEGITVPDAGYNFFEVASFSAKHRLLPLLRGNFAIEEIVVDGPKFTLVQRADGDWKTPELPEDSKPSKKPGADHKPTTPEGSRPKPKPKDPDVIIERVTIINGSAHLFDKDRRPFLSAHGLRVSLKDVRSENLMGRVITERMVLHGSLAVTDFSGGVSHSDTKGLIIPDFVAKCGGGTITGAFARKDEEPMARYSGKAQLVEVDLTRAALDGDAAPPNLTGLLSASVEFRGTGDDSKTMSGKGTVTLRNGTCREIETVKQYGEVLQLEEISNFGIPLATADFQIWNGRLNVKPLTISAPPITIIANGTARLDGKLDLDAVLGLDAKVLETRPSIAGQFSLPDASGMRVLPFNVNGTLTKPKNDLRAKLAGSKDSRVQKAVAIEAAIESIFGPGETSGKKLEPEKKR